VGIARIPGIRGIGPANAPLVEREVPPPFALDRSDRMGDDAYNGSGEGAERGLEEADSAAAEEASDDSETSSVPGDPTGGVSFFA
jgi:hypothetical protein